MSLNKNNYTVSKQLNMFKEKCNKFMAKISSL